MIPACPIAAARDALVLMQTGRASMAVRIMEALPGAIEAVLRSTTGEAYLRGQADAHRAVGAARKLSRTPPQPTASPPPEPYKPHRLELLCDALADPVKRQLVKATLGMGDRLLERVAAGGATLSGAQWRRLREALA